MKAGVIYLITNTVNGNLYVGQTTKSSRKRFSQHKAASKIPKPEGALHRAMKKYGFECFIMNEICSTNNIDFIDDLERFFIKEFNSLTIGHGYNCETGGSVNKHLSEEVKAQISLRSKGKPSGFKGKTFSEEIKNHISNCARLRLSKPENHPLWGTHHSQETKDKIRKSVKKIALKGVNPTTGEILIFESGKAATRAGFFEAGISANISGRIKSTYKGYKWQKA